MRSATLPACSRSITVVAAIALALGGCTGWHLYTVEPVRVIEQKDPEQVRLYVREPSQSQEMHYVITRPKVVGDSIIGTVKRQPFQVAAADVTAVAVRRFDWAKTALLIAAPPALLFGLACLAACGGY